MCTKQTSVTGLNKAAPSWDFSLVWLTDFCRCVWTSGFALLPSGWRCNPATFRPTPFVALFTGLWLCPQLSGWTAQWTQACCWGWEGTKEARGHKGRWVQRVTAVTWEQQEWPASLVHPVKWGRTSTPVNAPTVRCTHIYIWPQTRWQAQTSHRKAPE